MVATAIEFPGGQYRQPRPLAHDLIETVISRLNVRVMRTIISDLKDHIYRARLLLESASGILDLDARPSDSIVLALKFDAPIFVSEAVTEAQARLSEASGQTSEDLYERLQQIRPEDFSNLSDGL